MHLFLSSFQDRSHHRDSMMVYFTRGSIFVVCVDKNGQTVSHMDAAVIVNTGNVHGGEAADCFSRVLLTGKTKRQMTSGEGHGIEIFLKIIFCNIVTFKIRL